jgi:sporulation-control protein spo0M
LALDAVYGQEQTGLEALKDESERKPYFGKQVPFVNNFDKFIKA